MTELLIGIIAVLLTAIITMLGIGGKEMIALLKKNTSAILHLETKVVRLEQHLGVVEKYGFGSTSEAIYSSNSKTDSKGLRDGV